MNWYQLQVPNAPSIYSGGLEESRASRLGSCGGCEVVVEPINQGRADRPLDTSTLHWMASIRLMGAVI